MTKREERTAKFIADAQAVHGDRYDYSESSMLTVTDTVTIICSTHGRFEQKVRIHLKGSNCPLCANLNRGKSSSGQRLADPYLDTNFVEPLSIDDELDQFSNFKQR